MIRIRRIRADEMTSLDQILQQNAIELDPGRGLVVTRVGMVT